MNASLASVSVRKLSAATRVAAGRRGVPGRRAIRAAVETATPRFDVEGLEQRRLLSGGGGGGGFGDHGYATVAFNGDGAGVAQVNVFAAAPDGKVYVGGQVYGNAWELALARFNADGTPDATFGDGGAATMDVGESCVADRILIQPDGKVVVTGETQDGLAVGRFNADGSVDTSFAGGGKVYDVFNAYSYAEITEEDAAWLAPDGDVVVMAMKGADVVTLKLGADGQPDASFGVTGIANATVDPNGDELGFDNLLAAMPIQGGGVLAYVNVYTLPGDGSGGLDWSAQPEQQLYQVRLDAGGRVVSQKAVQTGLTPGTGMYGDFPPDPVVILGKDGSAYVTMAGAEPRVAKLNLNGDLDTSFGNGGLATAPGRYAQVDSITADGKVLVQTGRQDTYDFNADGVIRLNADGSLDTTFNGGQPVGEAIYPAYAMPDGTVLLGLQGQAWGGDWSGVPSFVIEKVGDDGLPLQATDAQSGGGTDDSQPSDPAVLTAIAAGKSMETVDHSIFVPADGATVWNPDGDPSVYDV